MTRLMRSYLALSGQEKRVALELAVKVPLIELALLLVGFKQVAAFTWPAIDDPRPTNQSHTLIKSYSRLLHRVSRRRPVYGHCLAQSLALASVLRRAGISVELRFGQRRKNDKILAHAWLEHEGKPVNDTADVAQRFPPFDQPILPA